MDHDLPTLHLAAALVIACAVAEGITRFFLTTAQRVQGHPLPLPADLAALGKFFELLDEWDREYRAPMRAESAETGQPQGGAGELGQTRE
jgi:hypothetical protein